MTPEEIAQINTLVAKWEERKTKASEPIPLTPRQHDEDACPECAGARERKWPPSLCCNEGYLDRERCRRSWSDEDSTRRAQVDYAARDLAPHVPRLLDALEAARKERDEARQELYLETCRANVAHEGAMDERKAKETAEARLAEAEDRAASYQRSAEECALKLARAEEVVRATRAYRDDLERWMGPRNCKLLHALDAALSAWRQGEPEQAPAPTCPDCDGSGKVKCMICADHDCPKCAGGGK